MNTIDEDLSHMISMVTNVLFQCLTNATAVVAATKGTFLVLFFPLAILYKKIYCYYSKANSEIVRYEALTRSPIYVDFSQTLGGVSSIRAYTQQERFIENLEGLADQNTTPGIMVPLFDQWLGIRLDFMGAMVSSHTNLSYRRNC